MSKSETPPTPSVSESETPPTPSVSESETPPTDHTSTTEASVDEHQVEEDPRPRPMGEGQVVESEDTIILEEVPIITPNRDVVVAKLSFQVRVQILSEAHTWSPLKDT